MARKKKRRGSGGSKTLAVVGLGVATADAYDTGIAGAISGLVKGTKSLELGAKEVALKTGNITTLSNIGIRRFIYGVAKKMVPSIPIYGKFRIGF